MNSNKKFFRILLSCDRENNFAGEELFTMGILTNAM